MDYFARRDVRAEKLAKDSAELQIKVSRRDSLIYDLKLDKSDLKQQYLNEQKKSTEYKNTASSFGLKYIEAQDKSNRRKKAIVRLVIANLVKDFGIGIFGYFALKP